MDEVFLEQPARKSPANARHKPVTSPAFRSSAFYRARTDAGFMQREKMPFCFQFSHIFSLIQKLQEVIFVSAIWRSIFLLRFAFPRTRTDSVFKRREKMPFCFQFSRIFSLIQKLQEVIFILETTDNIRIPLFSAAFQSCFPCSRAQQQDNKSFRSDEFPFQFPG